MIALIIGINSSAKAERRSWAFGGKLWRSRFTRLFFRIAGIAIRPEDRAAPSTDTAAVHVTLPSEVRKQIPELQALLSRYDEALSALRRREEEVERALTEAGASGNGDGARDASWRAASLDEPEPAGVTTRAVLLHRRLSLVNDLRNALDTVRAQRTDVVAAHENVRIQLARLRAGLARTADLEPDVATLRAVLDAAAPSA
jgi:hypothetical protein